MNYSIITYKVREKRFFSLSFCQKSTHSSDTNALVLSAKTEHVTYEFFYLPTHFAVN